MRLEKEEICTGAEFAKMAPNNNKNIIIQRNPYYKKLTKKQKFKYTKKSLKEDPEDKTNENEVLNNNYNYKGEIKEMIKNKKTRSEYRRIKEALLVSPSGQSMGRNSINEDEDFDYGPIFNGENLKTSTSEYRDIPHYEVNFENTGLDDEGVLYVDPETDGTTIIITKVEEDGSTHEYELDLTFPTPSLSSNDPAYTGFTESKRRVLARKSLSEKRNRVLANKKRNIKEGEPRLVNNFKRSLGNYLTSHQIELSKARTTDDLITLVSGALGLGNDTYVNKILDDIETSSFARGQYELYNILLKGEGNGSIR